MPLLTKNQVAIRIIAIITSAEVLIMLAFPAFTRMDTMTAAIIDGALLAVFSTPPIYFLVVRPFVDAWDQALANVSSLASTDALTQLANRRQVSERLEKATRGSVMHHIPGALLLVDLDGFKLVNDIHGHDAGDALLVEMAHRLRSVTREEDVVGRLGGDEFIVLINRIGTDERTARAGALRIADKLLEAVSRPAHLNGKMVRVGASIGVRLLGFDNLDAPTALHEVDLAMYSAKQSGKGRVVFFEQPRLSLVASC